jgi:hypothetical protein
MLTRKLWMATCAALALLGSSAPADEGSSVVWSDAGHTAVRFISGPVLDKVAAGSPAEVGGAPLPTASTYVAKLGLESLFKETQETLRAHPDLEKVCFPIHEGITIGPLPQAHSLSLTDLVLQGEIAVVGTVERTVPGIEVDTQDLATHTFVRVTEVMRDTSKNIRQGQVISFVQLGGMLSYRGTRLCSDSGGEHVPVSGERLLVIAGRNYGQPNPHELAVLQLFVVSNGNVIPDAKAYPYLKDSDAKSLGAVRAELAAKGGGGRHE